MNNSKMSMILPYMLACSNPDNLKRSKQKDVKIVTHKCPICEKHHRSDLSIFCSKKCFLEAKKKQREGAMSEKSKKNK